MLTLQNAGVLESGTCQPGKCLVSNALLFFFPNLNKAISLLSSLSDTLLHITLFRKMSVEEHSVWSHKILTTPERKLEIKMLFHAGLGTLFCWLFFLLSFPFMESKLFGSLSLDMSCSLHLSYSPGRRRGLQGTNGVMLMVTKK